MSQATVVRTTATAQSTSGSEFLNGFSRTDGVSQNEPVGTKEALQMLPENGANIAIESVAYLKDHKSPTATLVAVSMNLTFNMKEKFVELERASISFSVQLSDGASRGLSKRKGKPSLFQRFWNVLFPNVEKQHRESSGTLGLPFIYPNKEERVTVETEIHQRDTTGTLSPKLGVSAPVGVNLELGSYSTHDAYNLTPYISRVGTKTNALPEGESCIYWQFRNHNATFYPASHTLIILMRGDSKGTDTPSTFKIRIDRLEVKNYTLLKNAKWESVITGNHNAELVDNILRAYRGGRVTGISLAELAVPIGRA
ncbi:hypothetical protein C8R45DRAFT_1145766 [Mycena sanguinolenta]|nr:hypothetical protein C8R45DRAFT_1145766 [Mycena sanguinolenta]